MPFSVSPQQRQQADAGDDPLAFAGPMTGDKVDLPAVQLIQGAVVGNQAPSGQINMLFGFCPQTGCCRKQTMELSGMGIMRRAVGFVRVNTLCFRAAINLLCADQEIYGNRIQLLLLYSFRHFTKFLTTA